MNGGCDLANDRPRPHRLPTGAKLELDPANKSPHQREAITVGERSDHLRDPEREAPRPQPRDQPELPARAFVEILPRIRARQRDHVRLATPIDELDLGGEDVTRQSVPDLS
jgi:hypothetical protein